MTTSALIGLVGILLILAVLSRKAFSSAARHTLLDEPPMMLSGLSEVVLQLNKWKSEKRITTAEYERLMKLCEEDVNASKKK